MTESQFRGSEQDRNRLREILSDSTFRAAFSIIITKRRVMERGFEVANLDGDALQSLRLFNQRIGMEDVLLSLHELTTPQIVQEGDLPSTFGNEHAYQQLQQLQDANNQ
jgi:hypothetical protein